MKSILPKRLDIEYDDIDKSIRANRVKVSEHVFVREKIINDISNNKKLPNSELHTFNTDIKRLYAYRVISDYKNECVYRNVADEAILISKKTIKILTEIYCL
jgi:hypothetical protein